MTILCQHNSRSASGMSLFRHLDVVTLCNSGNVRTVTDGFDATDNVLSILLD